MNQLKVDGFIRNLRRSDNGRNYLFNIMHVKNRNDKIVFSCCAAADVMNDLPVPLSEGKSKVLVTARAKMSKGRLIWVVYKVENAHLG